MTLRVHFLGRSVRASVITSWRFSTRTRLLLLVAAVIVPFAVFAGLLVRDLARSVREHYPLDAQTLASTVSLSVDQEIAALIATAETLALSPSLTADPATFRQRAAQAVRRHGTSVELRTADGTILVDTSRPDSGPVPASRATEPERLSTDRRVLETGEPAVSDVFTAASGRLLVIVDVPVRDPNQPPRILSLELDPNRLLPILDRPDRADWTISLVDRADRIIARSRQMDRYAGQLATEDLRRFATGQSGTWTGTTLDGQSVIGAYVRSAVSGWRVAVGIPLATIDAPLAHLTWLIALSGLAVVAAVLAIALLIARTISRPIARLAAQAERLERGERLVPLGTGLVEVDEVDTVLTRAETAIAERGADLRRSEARFRAAVAAIEGVIWTNDPSGKMRGEQPGWTALTGQSEAEYRDYGWSRAVHPDDAAPSVAAWERAVAETRPFVFQHRVRRRDGVYRHFSVRAIPNLDEHGRPIEWVGVHTDITDEFEYQKLLAAQEAQLRDLNATLEQRVAETSAERDRIWRISSELMMVARLDGTLLNVNPSWSVHLGWSEAELRHSSLCHLLHPDDVLPTRRQGASLAQRQPVDHFENRLRHRDGTYRWLAWTAVLDAGLVHAIGREVTAEKEAAEALRRTEEQLRQSQKMEVVGQLTGGIAHDFNNLLTVVSGHLEMGLRRVAKPEERARLERHLNAALDGARRAAVLTHRLLAFSRQSALRPETLDLNAVIAGMREMISRVFGELVTVETVFAPDLCLVTADLNQVESAILNLCVNARDAMEKGGRLRVETSNAELEATARPVLRGDLAAGTYAVVAVTDTGEGIPPELQERVFEPFFTTKPVGKGTGLGLSQVFGFMRQSGGTAMLESELGAGTTVRLYFPRATEAVTEAKPPSLAATVTASGAGRTCLVVEDEDMVRDFSVAALEEAGYRVLSARDGAAGLQSLAAAPRIDLLFVDMVLGGGMDGREFADEARRRQPGLKVLFTTGYTRDENILAGRLGDAADVIMKPFDAASLLEKVRALLAPEPLETGTAD